MKELIPEEELRRLGINVDVDDDNFKGSVSTFRAAMDFVSSGCAESVKVNNASGSYLVKLNSVDGKVYISKI